MVATFFEQLVRDVRYALRSLRRQPSFAAAAIAVMVLGVGATTAVFSVLRGVLITPLPYRDPAQLVLFRAQLPGATSAPGSCARNLSLIHI